MYGRGGESMNGGLCFAGDLGDKTNSKWIKKQKENPPTYQHKTRKRSLHKVGLKSRSMPATR